MTLSDPEPGEHMLVGTAQFGTELRRRRSEAGLSLAGLAKQVHYSKSHLSKVETGAKPPSTDLARRCDAALGCEGALAQLAGPPARDPSVLIEPNPGEVWVLSLDVDGPDRFGALSRRELFAGGIAGLVVLAGLPAAGPAEVAPATLASFREMFDQLRRLGQHLEAPVLLPVLAAQTHALRRLAASAGTDRQRAPALRLAARFAEYAGWMAQEAGDDGRACWWTDRAVELAAGGEDRDLAAYANVRRALISLYRHDAAQTVALARRAAAATSNVRVLGLAAQREAQGHALAGDATECWRSLDRATELLAQAYDDDGPVLGTSHVADPAALAAGWCRYDLGEPGLAAELLDRELARIPVHATRARARFGARLALAFADSSELEQACVAVEPVLATYEQVRSATVRIDLRSLARTLNRWQRHPATADIRLRLTAALSTGHAA